MSIRGILFDKDGTLLDLNRTWVPVYRTAALAVSGGDQGLAAQLLDDGGLDDNAGYIAPDSLLASGTTDEIAARWGRWRLLTDTEIWPLF